MVVYASSPLHKGRTSPTWYPNRDPFIARPGHKGEGHDVIPSPTSRTNKGVSSVMSLASNGSASGSSRTGYHYFNFTAEPPRIYLGARLMSLEIVADSAQIGDRNARARARARARSRLCTHDLLINGTCVDRNASLQTRDDRARFEIGTFPDWISLGLHLRPLEFAYRVSFVCRRFLPRILWSTFFRQKFHRIINPFLLSDYDSKGAI